jgi:hypothetical protein
MRHKSKTAFGDGFDITRSLCVIAQRLPEFSESRAEALVKIDKRIGWPQAAADFLAAHHFSGTVQEQEKKLSRLLLQADAQTSLAHLPGCGVHLKDSETEDSRRLRRFLHSYFLERVKV